MSNSEYDVRDEIIDLVADRTPVGVRILRAKPYPAGFAARKVVISAYHPNRFPDLDYESLNEHERWTVADFRYRKLAGAAEAIRQTLGYPPFLNGKRTPMTACYPAGYLCSVGDVYCRNVCGQPVCLCCHARSVGKLVVNLLKAVKRRPTDPPDRPFYVGVVRSPDDPEFGDDKTWAAKWFQTRRTAGGVAFRYREHLPGGYRWRYSLVVVSNTRKSLTAAGITDPVRTRSRFQLAALAARWLHYPGRWSGRKPAYALADTLREYRSHAKVWRYQSFGVCSDGYVAGRSWCDFDNVGVPGDLPCPPSPESPSTAT